MTRTGWLPLAAFLVFASTDGCGGRVDISPGGGTGAAPNGGSGPTGGDGGMPSGGYGGMPSGGYGGMPSGGYGGGNCGANCPSWKVGGLIAVSACCADGLQCGALFDATISSLTALPQGCYALGQPGGYDPSCPAIAYTSPLDGKPYKYDGCCRSQSGTCGNLVDLTDKSGPNLGCADLGAGGGGPQKCGGTPDCPACVQTYCASELSFCTANTQCMSIFNCMSGCVDQACVDKCIASYPGGKADFYAFQSCVQAKCSLECQ